MLNNINVMGRIVKDLELKTTTNGKSVISFSIAVDSTYGDIKKGTNFFGVIAWDSSAEFIAKYFAKGKLIVINGYLHNREYEYKGRMQTKTEIVVKEVHFAGREEDSSNRDDSVPVLSDCDVPPEAV